MKKTLLILLLILGLVPLSLTAQTPATPNYMEGGGAVWNIGGDLDIESGGDLNIKSGGDFEIESGADINIASGGAITVAAGGTLSARQVKHVAKSVWFNLDNGAGTTVDDVIIMRSGAITITKAQIVYVDATSGTVAAGNAKLGTTLAGSEIVAATAYGDAKAVGTATAMTIVSGAVAANGSVFVRHTGVAATQAGQAFVEIEYTID